MAHLHLNRYLALFSILTIATTTVSASAEIAGAVIQRPGLQVQCSYCEDSDRNTVSCTPKTDINYCSCRSDSQSATRVLAKDQSTKGFIAFDSYIKLKVAALHKKLKKQRKSKAVIKKNVAQLVKKLTASHRALLSQCSDGSSIGLPNPSPDLGNVPLERISRKGPYTLYMVKKFKHSFAFDISEEGRIAGAFMTEEPAPDPTMPTRSSLTGLRIGTYYSAKLTPFVWSQSGLKRACDNCQGLLLTSLNDSGKKAVGTLKAANSGSEAVVFNYTNGALASLPTSTGTSAEAVSINESNVIVGRTLGASEVDKTAAVWSNGAQQLLPRAQIIDALDARLKPLLEADIKKEMLDNQDLNECSTRQIQTTQLVGRPRRSSPAEVGSIRITDSGDTLGYIIDPFLEWSYVGECQSGTHYQVSPGHNFVLTRTGSLLVYPSFAVQNRLSSETFAFSLGTALNSLGELIGFGGVDIGLTGVQLGRLNFRALQSEWITTSVGGPHGLLLPNTINDQGLIAGQYAPKSEGEALLEPKAFALVDGVFADLNDLMGLNPSAGLALETVSAANNCGVMVGRAYDSVKKQNHLFILAKDGCRIPS